MTESEYATVGELLRVLEAELDARGTNRTQQDAPVDEASVVEQLSLRCSELLSWIKHREQLLTTVDGLHMENTQRLGKLVGELARAKADLANEVAVRAAAEQKLRQLNESLDRRVEARTADAHRELEVRKRTERELKESLREKETLLKEVHHRVKNNLQIVSSLLHLQFEQSTEPAVRDELLESVARVRSMALIHQELYAAPSLARIDVGAYTRNLVDILRHSTNPNAEVEVSVDPVAADLDQAAPFALILNELVTNAFKHGHSPNGCNVQVVVAHEDSGFSVTVRDEGPGLPNGFDPHSSATLGIRLIDALVRQLRGKLTITTGRGSTFRVLVPQTKQQT